MNFKRYHVSNNLCPPISSANGWVIGYRNTNTGEYVANNNNREWLSPFFDIRNFPNGFVISADNSLSPNSMTVYYYNGDTYLAAVSSANYSGAVFTRIPNYTTRFCFAIRAAAKTEEEEIASGWRVWLNKGSTPQPYEPYSSEVWHDTPHYIHNISTDTLTTLPAVLYPNAVTATVGLQGNMQQSSTPTPQTPIQPSECGDRTPQVMPSAAAETKEVNGITITCDGNGTYTVSGTATADAEISFTIPEFTIPISVGRGGNGTLSFFNTFYNTDANKYVISFLNGDTLIDAWSLNVPNRTHTAYALLGGKICNKIALKVARGVSTNGTFAIMFTDDGQLPSTYEPYGYKIPILNNSQTTNVCLGETQSTRRIKKVVLDGTEELSYDSSFERFRIYHILPVSFGARATPMYCTHYTIVDDGRAVANVPYNATYSGLATADDIYVKTADYTTKDSYRAYIEAQYAAGTPITFYVILATPTTGVVNEPIRKIGNYADTVSGITIPTIAGVNTLSIGTTLQPSEVTATYKGWHPVQSVHERESGEWD